ncbi:NAD-dependent epimerase [Glycomyces fuscus]|nr:NAD-dependent epimerase [Glycomyces fuscus]
MVRTLVTGANGFIGRYLVRELLARGHEVVGVDNNSKYGEAVSPIVHPHYEFIVDDARDVGLVTELASGCDYFVAGAALVGGVPYIHTFPYDILATNERITAAACDAAITAHRTGSLRKVVFVSSSMVFDTSTSWPTAEGSELTIPPPRMSYGFQKLAVEYFARAAHEQYGLPYTIVRPFNCVGTGEVRAVDAPTTGSGDIELAMSHVVPDLIHKLLLGQDPLRILGSGHQVRHFTAARDLVAGIATAIEHPRALNEDFNLSSPTGCTIRELAELIHLKVRGPEAVLRIASDPPYPTDVAQRQPDVSKARELLGWEATTTLEETLDEVIPWVSRAYEEKLL